MTSAVDPSPERSAPAPEQTSRDPFALFQEAARGRPLRAGFGLALEYATFAAGLGLALTLFATRVPMRLVDRALGSRLRERFTDLLAKVSPG